MNKCKNRNIPCPYALTTWAELPCFGTQQQCDQWRRNWQESGQNGQNAVLPSCPSCGAPQRGGKCEYCGREG